MKPRYKVDGSRREWFVWEWHVGAVFSSWIIAAGPYLTKSRAVAEKKRLEKP